MLKIYEYKNCSTCKKAIQFLESKKLKFERIAIVETPPTPAELKNMLGFLKAAGGGLKNLFNTSGEQYRALKIADKLKAGMSEGEAIQLLAKNGKLIKRPFLLLDKNGSVGFKEDVWKKLLR